MKREKEREEKIEVEVDLAGATFTVALGEKAKNDLGLLAGVSTPGESQKLARLLRQLRAATPTLAVGEDGKEETVPAKAKRLWLEALRSAELSAAEGLRQALQRPGGTDQYLRG